MAMILHELHFPSTCSPYCTDLYFGAQSFHERAVGDTNEVEPKELILDDIRFYNKFYKQEHNNTYQFLLINLLSKIVSFNICGVCIYL